MIVSLAKATTLKGIACFGLWIFCLAGANAVRAQEALCADVKIEILQELTMERQGFEALMRITNSLDSFSLENVSISVHFADADGNPVIATSNTAASDAAFFIRVDDTKDVSNLQIQENGLVEGGTIAPKKVGEVRWLIIPTANAAGNLQGGRLYYVGAQLNYSYGGKQESVDVAPDTITVKPQPALTLDYFLTEDIIGDDAFTPEIEPPEPYTLGVRISNSGYGYANSVKIESAQPTIVENELGLAVDFKILGSYVEDQPAAPTLLIDFGNIEPQGVTAGRWIMQTNLAGRFTGFTASFTHADELGGELTSLLQGTHAHFLLRDVLVDLSGRDSVRDFLAYNPHRELYVYESENTGLTDPLCNSCAPVEVVDANLNGQGATSALTHEPVAGFMYAQVADPFAGDKVLYRVLRSDGKELNPRNAWLSKKRASDDRSFDYFINIFDVHSTGAYTLFWTDLVEVPQAPVIQHIRDWVTYEGGSLGFLVQASDPNGTVPELSVKQAPTGATLSVQGSGTGVFQWNPAVGQAGTYRVTFVASDGELNSERSVTITVHPEYDTDGDGMDDAWEMAKFGTLDRDGTGDYDGDGRSDLQEFQEGSDPLLSEIVPGTPQIKSPVYNEEILEGTAAPWLPVLTVTNGNHGAGINDVALIFEVFSDASLSTLVATATIDEATGVDAEGNPISVTSLQMLAEHLVDGFSFSDNTAYYWRVRALDKINTTLSSSWVKSRFFINSVNDAPSVPGISSPDLFEAVADLSPILSITNSTDMDGDRLYYGFSVFADESLDVPLAEVAGLLPGANGQTSWRIPKVLVEDGTYTWKATVTDEHGLATDSEWGMFVVSTLNHPPTAPVIHSPLNGSEVTQLNGNGVDLVLINGVDPERAPLSYYFEIDTSESFDSEQLLRSGALGEGAEMTRWTVDDLLENATYYWRARASDGDLFSAWVGAEFIFNAVNEAPSTPTINNPVDGSVVTTLQPLFDINPSTDPEGDAITYRFQLFADAALTSLVVEAVTTAPQWPLDIELVHAGVYYWRVRAEDDSSLVSAWSASASFTAIDPGYNEPPSMNFVLPATDVTVENNELRLQWVDSDSDSAATISLFYVDEVGGTELIVSGLQEDADGDGDQYLWNTQQLAAGVYHLYAVIADEETEVTVELCCTITIPEKVDKVINVNAQMPFVTNEQGTVDALVQVSLSHAPEEGHSVTLNFTVNPADEARVVGVEYLHFDTQNWASPQSIIMRGVDDCEIDGEQSFELVFQAAVSGDPAYNGYQPEGIVGSNADNELASQVWFICDYELVEQVTVEPGVVDFTYRALLRNTGESLPGAVAQVAIIGEANGSSSQSVQGEGKVHFPSVGSGESVWSSDTFVMRHSVQEPTDFAKLEWAITPIDDRPDRCNLVDENAGDYPAWNASTAYQQGEIVAFEDLLWRAKWWTQNQQPLSGNSAWDLESDVELPWHSTLVYEANEEVNHNGRRWRARWWTQNQIPGQASVWEEVGTDSCGELLPPDDPVEGEACDTVDPQAGSFPTWNASVTYAGGERVNYQHLVWEAKWWNSGVSPDSAYAPWRLISDVNHPWTATLVYEAGDEVNHNGQRWRANWWVSGEEPGKTQAWSSMGASSCL